MPNLSSWVTNTIKKFKEDFARLLDYFQDDPTVDPAVTAQAAAQAAEQKIFDEIEEEFKAKDKAAQEIANKEAKAKATALAREVENQRNAAKAKEKEEAEINRKAQIEGMEKLIKELRENSLSNNNVILDAVEKLSISTQAQVGATIDNAKLNAGLSATISDQLQNSNNESYVLDYNITSIFGQRQTFNITPKNYLN